MSATGTAQSPVGDARRTRLAAAHLYLVCDSTPGGRDLETVLRQAIAGGVDVVQLRDKALSRAELLAAADRARSTCHELGALFLVNDHADLAARVQADGVHLGQRDMPAAEARELLGADALVGLSTHKPLEIEHASRQAAGLIDYIGVGPVHATPTKPGRPAVGVELVRHAAAHSSLPFFAIGGIDASNMRGVIAAGATRVAVVRAIAQAADPERASRELHQALAEQRVEHAAHREHARTAA